MGTCMAGMICLVITISNSAGGSFTQSYNFQNQQQCEATVSALGAIAAMITPIDPTTRKPASPIDYIDCSAPAPTR